MYTEFDAPIYGTRDGLPVIVVGAIVYPPPDGRLEFITVDGDGDVGTARLGDFKVDVRFQDNAWHDVSPGPETPEE